MLTDPEEYDRSEECFAASLEQIERERVSGGTLRRLAEAHARAAIERFADTTACAQAEGCVGEENEGVEQGAFWKQEVSSRLENYRARRRRPLRERSLPLDFERAVNREMTQALLSSERADNHPPAPPDPAPDPVDSDSAIAQSVQADPVAPYPDPEPADAGAPLPVAVEPESNIIEFPRQPPLPVMPPSCEELAETILDRPRILEVPEEVDAQAPLSDISVAPESEQHPPIEFELPLLVASMSRRVLAGVADALVVIAATALFGVVAFHLGVPVPREKTGFLLAMAVPGLLWAMYEYLFLVYAATTIGIRLLRLQLITFDGEPPRRRSRRVRALAMVLSTLSLGLGIAWALLDEDTLCWHDRITRTYLVAASS